MLRRRLGFVAAWTVVLMAVGCDTGTPRRPPDPLDVRPTITISSSYRYDQRSIARLDFSGVVFLDPTTGNESGTVPRPKGPPGAVSTEIDRWLIVDAPNDTYVVFLVVITYPQDGLTPRSSESWIFTVSRGSGATVYERRIDLPEDPSGHTMRVDRTGTLVFTAGMEHGVGVVAVPFLPGRQAWSRQPEEGWGDDWGVLGAAEGVVLLWRETYDGDVLYGVDGASGTTVWGQRLPEANIRFSPSCVVRHGDRFVIIGDDWPLVVGIHDGAIHTTQSADHGCELVDPVSESMVDPETSVTAYDLTDGRRLWSMTFDQAFELGLEVLGIYDGRVYVETDTQRLVLDARTGQEVATGWVLFPLSVHDGWILARHISYASPVVYPGTELPTPPTATAA
jgi:outer membrane protein assembly factor BamB